MTAYPNPTDFANLATGPSQAGVMMRPSVTEHFWGYEVCMNEQLVDIAVLMRAMCGFLAVASVVAAIGVWMLPAMAFVATAVGAKATVSVLLLCIATILGRIAARSTRLRVQINTAAGEVREVVEGPFKTDVVLARHGFDTVDAIKVVASHTHGTFGQVQITVNGIGVIPVGDGAVMTLAALRNRIADDCGLEAAGTTREAVWGGPLHA